MFFIKILRKINLLITNMKPQKVLIKILILPILLV